MKYLKQLGWFLLILSVPIWIIPAVAILLLLDLWIRCGELVK